MAMQTPRYLTTDIYLTDRNIDGLSGMIIPLNLKRTQLHCKLQIAVFDTDEAQKLKQILARQPIGAKEGNYAVEISIYNSTEDTLQTFPEAFAVDAILACVASVPAADMRIEWKW